MNKSLNEKMVKEIKKELCCAKETERLCNVVLKLKNEEFEFINEETGEREILKLTDDQIKSLVKLKPVDYYETVELIPSLQACLVKDDIDKILSILNN